MNKTILTFLLIFFSLVGMNAQNNKGKVELKLWEQGTPNENGIKPDAKNYWEASLTIYPASKGRNTGKCIIACPGGGYSHLATAHEGHDMADWFNAQGITYAVLVYRMPNKNREVPLSDAQQAIRIIRSRATEWGITHVGIMGSSAGGHLASTAATHFNSADVRPDFQILFYPVISLENEITHQGTRKNLLGNEPSDELVAQYSNYTRVTPQTPPAFIMHSSDDRAVPVENSLRYYRALVQNKVPVAMHLYPIGGHGWGFRNSFIYKEEWTHELEKWLRELKL